MEGVKKLVHRMLALKDDTLMKAKYNLNSIFLFLFIYSFIS